MMTAEYLLHGVERAGADIAEDNAERAENERVGGAFFRMRLVHDAFWSQCIPAFAGNAETGAEMARTDMRETRRA